MKTACPVCGRPTAVRSTGKLYPHYAAGTERVCAGSGK